jgi:membrane protein implicated in regulation of membrane protease activity
MDFFSLVVGFACAAADIILTVAMRLLIGFAILFSILCILTLCPCSPRYEKKDVYLMNAKGQVAEVKTITHRR